MNLLELIYTIQERIRSLVSFVFHMDYSSLNRSVLGVASFIDIIALILSAYVIRDLVVFLFRISEKFIGYLIRTLFTYLSIQTLITVRSILLRARATLLYFWYLDSIQSLYQKCINLVAKPLNLN